ncbi:pheromone-regulated protein prm10 [Tilletia horrida]|nr:pheromone-regulated protein prm10 [Tilletia horrida]
MSTGHDSAGNGGQKLSPIFRPQPHIADPEANTGSSSNGGPTPAQGPNSPAGIPTVSVTQAPSDEAAPAMSLIPSQASNSTSAPGAVTSAPVSNPAPPKTNRVRWHGNADFAPSRLHAEAVAAAVANAAASLGTTARSSGSATKATTPPSASLLAVPNLPVGNSLKGAGANSVQNAKTQTSQGAGVADVVKPTASEATESSNIVSPNRVIRANHPGPLLLQQRLSETAVPGLATVSAGASTAPALSAQVPAATSLPLVATNKDGTAVTANPALVAAAGALNPSLLSAGLPLTQSPLPQGFNYSARELDERGKDEEAFRQLQAQLQAEVGRNGLGQERTIAGGGRRYEYTQAHQRRPSSGVSSGGGSGATSGASTPYSTDSSYDPAADSDLDHVDIIEGEVDGMPSRLSKRQKQRIREAEEAEREAAACGSGGLGAATRLLESNGWGKLRGLVKRGGLRRDGADVEAQAGISEHLGAEKSATAADEDDRIDRGGPTNRKSVLVTTSSGTHGGAGSGLKRKPTKHERQAAKLVRAHKLVSSGAGGSATGGTLAALPTAGGIGAALATFQAHGDRASDDGEGHSGSSTPDLDARPLATGGVLGNLLKLYEQEIQEAESMMTLVDPAPPSCGVDGGADSRVIATAPAVRAPTGASRLRTSHLVADSPADSPYVPDLNARRRSSAMLGEADNIEDMSPEALAARALEKERQARIREIEEQLRRTLEPRPGGRGPKAHRRGRSTGGSSLANLMSSEYRKSGAFSQPRTPRRSFDAVSTASAGEGTAASTTAGSAAGGRRPMLHSISSSAFPISAAVIEKTQQSGKVIGKAATQVAKAAAAEYGLDAAIDERPKAARNGGGTIGALIATTGNLVGAVSPHLAQLGPNPRRPGFTLDRYLLPEMNEKTLRQTAEIIADAAPRRSIPGTPNYWASRSMPGSPDASEGTSRSRSHDRSRSQSRVGPGMLTSPSAPNLHDPLAGGARSMPVSPTKATTSGTMTGGSISPAAEKDKINGILAGGSTFGARQPNSSVPMSRATSNISGLKSMPATPGGHLRSRAAAAQHAISHIPGVHSAGNMLHRAWSGLHSGAVTPDFEHGATDYFAPKTPGGTVLSGESLEKAEWQRKLKKRQKKRRKEEIFITMHVAAILERQEFLLKLARALMMFGAPTHRIEAQLQHTARVLEINCRTIYLPNLMLLSFGDDTTRTSETKFIKQASALDLTKLTDMHDIYWNVVKDRISVTEASGQLDELMRRKPLIPRIPAILIGGLCSAFICVGSMGFNGSFIDAVAAFPLGMFLVYCQGIITTELYSNVFEIVFCILNSFVAAALHSTKIFCYSAVVSGSIVLILPGFIVLSGALELQSKNLIAGSVRLVYALIYSLFLGMGLSIGVDFWTLVRNKPLDNASYCDAEHHDPNVWYRREVPLVWAFLTVPGYSFVLSLRNQAKITRKETLAMVAIACAGWACNHFSATARTLQGRQDITSALGSLAVGMLANIYGRFTGGRTFVVAVTGILYQLPSGLSNGGLLNFVDTQANTNASSTGTSTSAFSSSGFSVAASLIEVALGLTVGLFAATIIGHYLVPKRHRGTMVFSF